MAESNPNPESPEEDAQTPIDSDEAAAAVREVQAAMAILPKKRFGCLGRAAKYAAVLFVLLAAFIYWNFLRTPGLVISKETTYITEPLTADGTRIDYFAAWERDLYPPEMKTDDNGYRMIVRALGDAEHHGYDLRGNEIKIDTEACTAQVYEKLGLDPAIKSTLTYTDPFKLLYEYSASEGLDQTQDYELWGKLSEPWTLDDLPMMEPWLEESGPALDLVREAVRRPAFCFPLVRLDEEKPLAGAIALGEIQRTRSFARMLQARAHYRIGAGDIDGAIDDVITCERLGRHLEGQGTMVVRLVGIAVEGISASVGVAAIRESQPTEEQLQRLVDELDALPPRPSMDRTCLAERYLVLDSLQAKAYGDEWLNEAFSIWEAAGLLGPGIAASLSVDWNIIMRRVNRIHDSLFQTDVLCPPERLLLGNLFIGARSRYLADFTARMYTPSIQAFREANRRTDCMGNLCRITLAMLIYERRHGTLPPAYTVDADGNPLHSWRVLLLPYLGEEELFGKLRLDEPWDSEHNRRFHEAALPIYQCPSAALPRGQTTYSVVVGEKTAFEAAEGKSLDDLGMNLILVVERGKTAGRNGRRQSICWMDPTSELSEAVALEGINRREEDFNGIRSPHPAGVNVGLRDGSVQFIAETIDLSLLQGLLDGTAEEGRY